jgi:hypothetical protein
MSISTLRKASQMHFGNGTYMYSGQDEAQEDQLNGKSIYMKKTTFPLFVLQKEKIINVK